MKLPENIPICLLVILFAISIESKAQYHPADLFYINNPVGASTYDGSKIAEMSGEELGLILLANENAKVRHHFNFHRYYKTAANISKGIVFFGVVKELYELKDLEIWQQSNAAGSFQPSSRLIKGGSVLIIISTITTILSNHHLKKSMKFYNESIILPPDQVSYMQDKLNPSLNISSFFKITFKL